MTVLCYCICRHEIMHPHSITNQNASEFFRLFPYFPLFSCFWLSTSVLRLSQLAYFYLFGVVNYPFKGMSHSQTPTV